MDYKAYLTAGGLKVTSAASYEDYLQRVVSELRVDLTHCDLSDDGIEELDRQLGSMRVNPSSRKNCKTALRSYADFLSGGPRRSRRGRGTAAS